MSEPVSVTFPSYAGTLQGILTINHKAFCPPPRAERGFADFFPLYQAVNFKVENEALDRIWRGPSFAQSLSRASGVTDYSHYNFHSLPVYAGVIDDGREPADYTFESILGLINPPLFGDGRDTALFRELCWYAPRAKPGRRLKGSRRTELAQSLKTIDRDDVPPNILRAIIARLEKPAAKDRLQKPFREHTVKELAKRDYFIRVLSKEFSHIQLHGEARLVPELVEFAARLKGLKKFALTKKFMGERLNIPTPSLGSMRNIVTATNRARRKEMHDLFVHQRQSEQV